MRLSLFSKRRHYFYALMLALILAATLLILIYKSMLAAFSQDMMEKNHAQLDLKIVTLKRFVETSKKMVGYLAHDVLVHEYIQNPTETNEKRLNTLFLRIVDLTPVIMQLRYIDAAGMERIRVDKADMDAKAFVTEGEALQDKSGRYYFQETALLKEGRVWLSDLDLNIEHGEIEIPFKPTLRVSTPVYDAGRFAGIMIINLHMKEIIEQIRETPGYNTYMIDKEGNFLIHPDQRYDWARQRGIPYNLYDQFPEYADSILSMELFEGDYIYSHKLPVVNREELRLVLISEIENEAKSKNSLHAILLVSPFALAIILGFMYLLSFFVIKKIRQMNRDMEVTIQKQVTTIREKELMLFQQSRMAIMGEMISMIAHQWRQPIATIGMTANNLALSNELGNLDDGKLGSYVDEINSQVAYLSQTIDDFRNFFKRDKIKQQVDVAQVIDESVNIIAKSLENHGIRIEREYQPGMLLTIFKGELQQVIINLLNNAKDAILASRNSGGLIVIRTVLEDQRLAISICDNGGGIPEEHFYKILEPYFTTKESNGTGLGLYMSKDIVEKHLKGTLEYRNENDGACFSILLLQQD